MKRLLTEEEIKVINNEEINCFFRSGLAARTDLQSPNYERIFSILEMVQDRFLKFQSNFRSTDYKWAIDALHWWSRIWEYPYVLHHLIKIKQYNFQNAKIKVMDFGSGVTFFPFLLHETGFEVTCVDNDAICVNDIIKAKDFFNFNKLHPILSEENKIPLESSTFDIIYSISVIEHIAHFETIIDELRRLLRNDGYIILTFDIGVDNMSELKIENFFRFRRELQNKFQLVQPEETLHPLDILYSSNSKYPLRIERSFKFYLYQAKLLLRSVLQGNLRNFSLRNHKLAVAGMVLKVKK